MVKSTKKQSYEITRGLFTGPEIENFLWDFTWLEWKSYVNKDGNFETKPLSLFDSTPTLHKAFQQLVTLLPRNNWPKSAWLERHKPGDWVKSTDANIGPGTLLILSLGQFRGGKTHVGDFKGYINPGEVLSIKLTKKSNAYQVEKVSSGERIVLCLVQKQQ